MHQHTSNIGPPRISSSWPLPIRVVTYADPHSVHRFSDPRGRQPFASKLAIMVALSRLTARQNQVLELVAKGLTNAEIGNILDIAEGTVRAHVSAVLATLEVSNRTEAAAFLAQTQRTERADQFFARPAIAVLPMDAEGITDPTTHGFALGVSDDLIRLLSRYRTFPVIARSSSLDGQALSGGLASIGTTLRARFLISGRVKQIGPRVHLSIHVDDTSSHQTIWVEERDVPVEQLFALHRETVEVLVARLYPHLVAAAALGRTLPSMELNAWQLTQLGMAAYAQRSKISNHAARAYFDDAIRQDKNLFLAHYNRGLTYYQDAMTAWGDLDHSQRELDATAERCEVLAPNAGETLFLQGRALLARGDILQALPYLRDAVSANPSFAEAYAQLGQMSLIAEDSDADSVQLMERAMRLSPRAYVGGLAIAQFARGLYADALASATDALEAHPDYTLARILACAAADALGEPALAQTHFVKLRVQTNGSPAESIRKVFGPHHFPMIDRIVARLRRLDV